jgi:hypothetical protein
MSHFAASLPLGHIVAVAQFAHPQHTVKAAPEHIPAVVRAARNDIDFRMLTIKSGMPGITRNAAKEIGTSAA